MRRKQDGVNNKVPIMEKYKDYEISIMIEDYSEAEEQLKKLGIENFERAKGENTQDADVNADLDLSWDNVTLLDVVRSTEYPRPKGQEDK